MSFISKKHKLAAVTKFVSAQKSKNEAVIIEPAEPIHYDPGKLTVDRIKELMDSLPKNDLPTLRDADYYFKNITPTSEEEFNNIFKDFFKDNPTIVEVIPAKEKIAKTAPAFKGKLNRRERRAQKRAK